MNALAPVDSQEPALIARLLRRFAPTTARERTELSAADVLQLEELTDPELLLAAGGMALGLGDQALARRLRRRAADRARSAGAAGTLAWILEYVVFDEVAHARFAIAESCADEGRRLALEAGRANSACLHTAYLAELAALRGRADDARLLADEALAEASERRLAKASSSAQHALGILALATGRPEEALEQLS